MTIYCWDRNHAQEGDVMVEGVSADINKGSVRVPVLRINTETGEALTYTLGLDGQPIVENGEFSVFSFFVDVPVVVDFDSPLGPNCKAFDKPKPKLQPIPESKSHQLFELQDISILNNEAGDRAVGPVHDAFQELLESLGDVPDNAVGVAFTNSGAKWLTLTEPIPEKSKRNFRDMWGEPIQMND